MLVFFLLGIAFFFFQLELNGFFLLKVVAPFSSFFSWMTHRHLLWPILHIAFLFFSFFSPFFSSCCLNSVLIASQEQGLNFKPVSCSAQSGSWGDILSGALIWVWQGPGLRGGTALVFCDKRTGNQKLWWQGETRRWRGTLMGFYWLVLTFVRKEKTTR